MHYDQMKARSQKRDKLSRCQDCGMHKVPPGTGKVICPDCIFDGIMRDLTKRV